MKKIALLVLLIPVIGFSQLKYPSETITAKKVTKENYDEKEVWLDYSFGYIIKFEQTPVGLKHLFEKAKSVLEYNNFEFNKPSKDDSLLASYSKDLSNYQSLNTALLVGDSEIDMLWNNDTSSYISIDLNDKDYKIVITKPKG